MNVLRDFNAHDEYQKPPYKGWKGIDSYVSPDCSVVVFVDEKEQEIIYRFPTLMGICTMKVYQVGEKLYQHTCEIEGMEPFNFQKAKPLHEIGLNNRNDLYRQIKDEFKRHNLHLPGDPDSKIDNFLTAFASDFIYIIKDNLDKFFKDWFKLRQELNVPSWFEQMGDYDHFPAEVDEKAQTILHEGEVIEVIYQVIELIAVAQKPKAILELLIALSSVFDKPLHSLISANPGKSKSTISKTVYDLFPQQRRIKFGKTTTTSGILNMTRFKEGSRVLKNKLIRIGDFGDTKEQEQAMEIISLLKELMSEGEYTKILTDMADEFGRAMVLKLRGCGSVHMEIISPKAESQYMSRSLLWSPDDNKMVQKGIMEYQEDELERVEMEGLFKHKRLLIARIIEGIFRFVDDLVKDDCKFEILNPYTSHFNALLRVKDSPNANRDRMMVQTIPKLVTLTNCYKRDVYYNERLNAYGLIVNWEDYIYTIKMLGKTLSHFVHKKPEVLGTYTTIIEEKLFGAGGVIRTLTFDDLREAVEKVSGRKHLDEDEQDLMERFNDSKYFTYKEFANYTTVTANTVREHLQELADMQLVYIDQGHRPHRVYIPSDYFVNKKIAFSGIFDYDMFLELELAGELELVSNSNSEPVSLQEDNIYSMHTEFLRRAEFKGWSKVSNSNTPKGDNDLGALNEL